MTQIESETLEQIRKSYLEASPEIEPHLGRLGDIPVTRVYSQPSGIKNVVHPGESAGPVWGGCTAPSPLFPWADTPCWGDAYSRRSPPRTHLRSSVEGARPLGWTFFLLIILSMYLAAPCPRCCMWDLVPWPGIEPGLPALGAHKDLATGPSGMSLSWSFLATKISKISQGDPQVRSG